MAVMVLTASYLAINSVNVSGYCSKIEISADVDEKDVTTFASAGWREVTGGIKKGQVGVELFNDFTDNELDEDMWTLFLAGVPTTFEIRGSNAAVGAANPKYTGSILINKWIPVGGKVGDVNGASYTWPTSGAVTRAVA